MNIDQFPFKAGAFSIHDIEHSADIIFQESTQIHKHSVEKGYLVLSKNDFGKVKKRINVGIFNKKTNFLIGEEHSLLVYDNEEKRIYSPNTSQIIKEPSRYFIIYDLNFIANFKNSILNIFDKDTQETIKLELNSQFGNDIGLFLRKFNGDVQEIPEQFSILKSIIFIDSGKLSLNKQVLVNSNFSFLLGILEGYLQKDIKFVLNGNINIYNFTYILNLLGAQYSIRSLDDKSKHIRFKLPLFLKSFTNLDSVFFRSYKYFFEDDKLILKKNIVSLAPNPEKLDFKSMVNTGLIEMIPAKDLVFIEIENQTMYDLTMSNANATNYSLPGTPAMKNSDGDVLGVVAIHTKDAAEECTRKFSTELKENFLSLTTGSVNNWGVKLDSQMGLYSATK